jgi:hypothetical protein
MLCEVPILIREEGRGVRTVGAAVGLLGAAEGTGVLLTSTEIGVK